MKHFRVIGFVWLLLALIEAVHFAPELWRMAADREYGIRSGFGGFGFWFSQFFVEGFLLLSVVVGFGLLRQKRWAAICMRVMGVLVLLYCLAFLLMGEFEHFHSVWLITALFGVAFSAYSLFVVWRFRPYDHAA